MAKPKVTRIEGVWDDLDRACNHYRYAGTFLVDGEPETRMSMSLRSAGDGKHGICDLCGEKVVVNAETNDGKELIAQWLNAPES